MGFQTFFWWKCLISETGIIPSSFSAEKGSYGGNGQYYVDEMGNSRYFVVKTPGGHPFGNYCNDAAGQPIMMLDFRTRQTNHWATPWSLSWMWINYLFALYYDYFRIFNYQNTFEILILIFFFVIVYNILYRSTIILNGHNH